MPKREMVQGLGAGHCMAALRTRYPTREYALLEQVANSTGWAGKRWADAIAVSLWPSRGLEILGFEIKVSRGDWKKELADPSKAESIQKHCDRWFIVAPDGMIEPSELPPTWGLLGVNAKSVATARVAAPKLEPEKLSIEFVAALFRRQSEVWEEAMSKAKSDGRADGEATGNPGLANRLALYEQRVAQLEESIRSFQKKSGIKNFEWRHGEIGDAVRALIDVGHRSSLVDTLTSDAAKYEHLAKGLRNDIETLKSVRTPEAAE
jgi:hypothetical protein